MSSAKKRTGRPRIEERHKTNEARRPWLALGMSKRTWYRRQAERRKKRQQSSASALVGAADDL